MGGALSDANSHQVGMVATRRFTLHPCSWLRSRTEQNVHGWEPEYWGGSAGSGGSGGTGGGGSSQTSACSAMGTGQGASLNGFRPFPADNAWNQGISALPVDANSDAIINFIGSTTGLHADFGSGPFQGTIIGIPYFVVSGSQAPVHINFTAFGRESDPGPMPIPGNALVEGDPTPVR